MKLEVYGDQAHGWKAHGEWENTDSYLHPCPFCGGKDRALILDNSHTPYYSVTCDECGAEGPAGAPAKTPGKIRTKKKCIELHREAFQLALELWNDCERGERGA